MKKILIGTLLTITLLGATFIKGIDTTEHGTLINFADGTGYFIEK